MPISCTVIMIRYMTAWSYSRTDTMPISCTGIMITSAGATFLPEYSERNLIVKGDTDVAQCQLHSFSGCICQEHDMSGMANPVITRAASATRYICGCISVLLYVLLLLYLSPSLSLILIPQNSAHYLTFPLDT